MREVLGIPVVSGVRCHDHHGTDCPFDDVRDSHIHIEHDYGDERLDLEAYGPGRRDADVVDAWDRFDRWRHRSVRAVPTWWDRIRGRILDRELERMARRLIASREQYRVARQAIAEVEERFGG